MKLPKPHLKAYLITRLPYKHQAVIMQWLETIVIAKNEHEARLKALSNLKEQDIDYDSNGDEFTYISVRLKRSPDHDRFMIDGKLKSRQDIEYNLNMRERDEEFKKLLADNPNSYAYIRKGGYYYKPNNCGYTEFQSYAGVYSLEEAVRACLNTSLSDYMRPILINNIDEHNEMINKQIASLQQRLIIER